MCQPNIQKTKPCQEGGKRQPNAIQFGRYIAYGQRHQHKRDHYTDALYPHGGYDVLGHDLGAAIALQQILELIDKNHLLIVHWSYTAGRCTLRSKYDCHFPPVLLCH